MARQMDSQIHRPEVAVKTIFFHPVEAVGSIHHQHTLKHIHKDHTPLSKFETYSEKEIFNSAPLFSSRASALNFSYIFTAKLTDRHLMSISFARAHHFIQNLTQVNASALRIDMLT
jgi:hypothetical protein